MQQILLHLCQYRTAKIEAPALQLRKIAVRRQGHGFSFRRSAAKKEGADIWRGPEIFDFFLSFLRPKFP
jgi:hypothetical protein